MHAVPITLRCLFVLSLLSGVGLTQPPHGGDDVRRAPVNAVEDGAITPWQSELLDLAHRAASEFPTHPHYKNRARAQEEVVDAALALDQRRRAIEYAEGIENWRQALALAKVAYWSADQGHVEDARRLAERARSTMVRMVERETPYETMQEWMGERVSATLAAVHGLLETAAAAAPVEGDDDTSVAARAAAEFERRLEALSGTLGEGKMDPVRDALQSCVRLYEDHFTDEVRRLRIEELVRASWTPVPLAIRIDVVAGLANVALNHGDDECATTQIEAAYGLLDSAAWLAQDRLPVVARLAVLRHRVGAQSVAVEELEASIAAFDEALDRIPDVFRARALRPAAEAWAAMGDEERAVSTYLRAIDEGGRNPNSRPRAEDLVATCCSIAVHGVEPTAELRARLLRAHDSLGAPW